MFWRTGFGIRVAIYHKTYNYECPWIRLWIRVLTHDIADQLGLLSSLPVNISEGILLPQDHHDEVLLLGTDVEV